MIQALRNAVTLPDLRRKLLYTLLILVVYRLAAHVPVPGADQAALASFLQQSIGAAGYFRLLNMLSGGTVESFSVLATGVQSYITATLVVQLLTPIIPPLQRLADEGESGQRKINQWTYYITIPLSMLQSYAQIQIVNQWAPVLPNFGFDSPEKILPTIAVLFAMTAGTMFAIWLGELISEQGIGNGLSLIIFSGVATDVPRNVVRIWQQGEEFGGAELSVLLLFIFLALMAVTMFVIVVVQEGERRVEVRYGKRVRGMKMYGGGSTYIPVRVNTAGMIPLIFAQAFLTFPTLIASFFSASEDPNVRQVVNFVMRLFSPYQSGAAWYEMVIYIVLYFAAVVGATYFYTDVLVQQQNLSGALQRQGGFIPGIRPGKKTADFINFVYRRITLLGALFLGGVAILPLVVNLIMELVVGVGAGSGTLLITASGLIIVVGTVIDTMRQLEAQLLMRHYEGFIR